MANCVQCGRKLPPLTLGKKICQWCVQHERAQRGEADEDAVQPVMATPWARRGESAITLTHVIFGANVAVFIAMVIASGSATDFPGQIMVHFGANVGPYTLSGQWWRLLTYMFLHGGVMHILFNMWCLWDLGALCESLYGRWTFGAIYLLTGIAAGLASVAWNPGVLSVGASGAIFGLAGALIASFALGEFSLPSFAIRGTLRSLIAFAAFNLIFGQFFGGIDNAAHIGGLISGLILGALIARIAPDENRLGLRAGVLICVALAVGASAFGVHRWRGSPAQFGRSVADMQRSLDRRIRELQKQIRQRPRDVSAHYALAYAYLTRNQLPEGEAELQRVLELDPQNARARKDLAGIYLEQHQLPQAEEEFRRLVAQDPNNADGHAYLGVALAEQQNHAAAIDEYKTALRLEPRDGAVYYRLGLSHLQLKQYDDAIASFLRARDQSGDDADLETQLAAAYEAKGKKQDAQEARNKAAQLGTAQ